MEEAFDKLGYKDFSNEGGVTSCCKRNSNILKRQHCERRGMNAMSRSIIRENLSGYVHIMRTHRVDQAENLVRSLEGRWIEKFSRRCKDEYTEDG